MSDAQLAAGLDRLPWLADEPKPRSKRGSSELAAWAAAAAILIAGASYWLGMRSWDQLAQPSASAPAPQTTVRLPQPTPVQPEVKLAPQPRVKPVVAPPMPVIHQPAPVAAPAQPSVESEAEPVAASPPEPAKVDPLQPWPARVVEGASGRLVQVGAFATVHQAKRGWWWLVRMNPTLQRLPAVVVPVQSRRNRRIYYRLQMGTTSQAHSAVLCQRLRMVALSCVVVDSSGSGSEGAQ